MKTWYKSNHASQGLILEEGTGKTIAVTYDPAHADLVAAAPELLAGLERLCTFQPRTCAEISADWDNARAALAKAKGE